jgi:hypothetical protein
MRTINDPDFRRIFCLVHAEKLSYQISDLALSSLSKHSQGEQGECFCGNVLYLYFIFLTGYRLVIISSNEEEEMSHFISKLHLYRRPFFSRNGLSEFRSYLASKLTKHVEEMEYSAVPSIPASVVDSQRYVIMFSQLSTGSAACPGYKCKSFMPDIDRCLHAGNIY